MLNQKYEGCLNLSKIPKNLITKNKKGESVIWVKIMPNYDGKPDQYGCEGAITIYDKENKKAIYLANLRPYDPQPQGQQSAQRAHDDAGPDLPW